MLFLLDSYVVMKWEGVARWRSREGVKLLIVVFVLNAVEDLFAVDSDVAWRIDTNPNLVPFDFKNADFYFTIINNESFAY